MRELSDVIPVEVVQALRYMVTTNHHEGYAQGLLTATEMIGAPPDSGTRYAANASESADRAWKGFEAVLIRHLARTDTTVERDMMDVFWENYGAEQDAQYRYDVASLVVDHYRALTGEEHLDVGAMCDALREAAEEVRMDGETLNGGE